MDPTDGRRLPDHRSTAVAGLRVLVVGGGLMGHSIAGVFATHDADVTIFEKDPAIRASIPDRIGDQLERRGLDRAAAASIRSGDDLDRAADGAELVIEAITENLALKQELFGHLGRVLPHAVLATNSSVFRPTEVAASTPNPARVLGTHWFNPPHLVPLVEVVQGEATAYEYIAWVIDLLEQVGKLPVHVRRDVPGFIGNRLQHALWREAIRLVEDGVCDAETIDTVVRNSFGPRLAVMGPMENADYVGLDLVEAVHTALFPSLCNDTEPARVLRDNVERGRLGAKSGAGFFEWPPGRRETVAERLDTHLLTSAVGPQSSGRDVRPEGFEPPTF